MGEITIRQYKDSDKDKIWDLHIKVLEDAGALADSGPWDDDLKNIQHEYISGGGTFLVGLSGDEIVVMGALKVVDNNNVEIKRMRVLPKYQRKGLGQLMLDKLEEKAVGSGYNQIQLDTTDKQIAAQNFYVKNGYKEVSRIKGKKFESIIYKKNLVAGI
ncbi:MAG: GNAT family N-acetyltransferase [bacterium]